MSNNERYSHRMNSRHADLPVHGATVLTPNGAERIDIACIDSRIVAQGDVKASWSAEFNLDASGLHLLPGVINSRVHFREPGMTHKENLDAGAPQPRGTKTRVPSMVPT
jgi:dihydroorotase